MKIQCDVCEKAEAVVFCTADEAALCGGCDKKVHHANKLAGKHLRFSLLEPSFSGHHHPPLCDICQERRAFLFCKEDRAILCRECDIPIHKTNEHTKKHTRFLLTGVKLSSSSYPYPNNTCPSSSTCYDPNSDRMAAANNVPSYDNNMFSQYSYTSNSNNTNPLTTTTTTMMINYNKVNQESSISTSDTISGYPMETLPEWRLEDLLLDHSSASDHNLCKTFDCTNTRTRVVNEKEQVEEVMSPFGSEDYSTLWEFYNEGPHVPSSHLPPIFLRTFS